MPLGGLGTGSVCLGGRGDLRQWEIVNRPSRAFTPPNSFFAVAVRGENRAAQFRLLEGPLSPPFEGQDGDRTHQSGLPRFRHATFSCAYPLAQVDLRDDIVPVTARLEAFNPLVPGDADASGLPVAVLRWTLTNTSDSALSVSVVGSLNNFVGTDGVEGEAAGAINTFIDGGALRGLALSSETVDSAAAQWGSLALATTWAGDLTHRTRWAPAIPVNDVQEFVDDLLDDGRLEERAWSPTASLCAAMDLGAGESRAVTFLLGWHFPNRPSWSPLPDGPPARVGNHYASRWPDAWHAVSEVAADLDQLEARTVRFVGAVVDSDVADVVIERALANVSTLRCQTCFRAEDGNFYGFEGAADTFGWCEGSCTHVWNYEQTLPYLFGDLARTMREVDFIHSTDGRGAMSFRTQLPLERGNEHGKVAADGQMGSIIRLYREWQLCGDDDFLRRLWPSARRALEYAWGERGWDADRDGVCEGPQHNTMDVEWFGPNPVVAGLYLGALVATARMAAHLGQEDFADECTRLYRQGREWVDANLFNGDWYIQRIQPSADPDGIPAEMLVNHMVPNDPRNPFWQLGEGCAADQLLGVLLARASGIGEIVDVEHEARALGAILEHNFLADVGAQVNPIRRYAVAGEAGVLVCSFPAGKPAGGPYFYAPEVWTGLEHSLAAHLLWLGRDAEAEAVVAAVQDRHDGARRNPFDETECGHHYVRGMAAWGSLVAATGFVYSAVDGRMRFRKTTRPSRFFWSTGAAWGTFAQDGDDVEVEVVEGEVRLEALELDGMGAYQPPGGATLGPSARLRGIVEASRGN